ncbi:MAG: hypothetical protein K8S18_01365, partial [Desulfobacula sp.]|nr:hypothetical protein [Desulfobacula sp.]
YYSFVSELGNDQPLFGLQCRGLDGLSEPFQSIKIMAEHYVHEILVLQPEGPYYLCGGSMGGLIALEVAQQLKHKGKQIGGLIMFDTYDPDYIYSVGNKNFMDRNDLIKKFLKMPSQKMIQLILRKIFHGIKNFLKQTTCLFFRFFKRPIPHTLRYRYIEQKHLKPLFEYKAQLYNGNLTLFFNSHDGLSQDSAMIKGWENYISGEINTIGISARHSEFIEDPILSVKLADCLKTIMPVSKIL